MKTASWVLIALAGFIIIAYSSLQVERAYGTFNDQLGGISLRKLAADHPEVETAVRSRRATAAAYSIGFATLLLLITAGPYRRGDVWAWWALLIGILVPSVIVLLRIPFLDTGVGGSLGGGAVTGTFLLLIVAGAGLALGAGRLRQGRPGNSA